MIVINTPRESLSVSHLWEGQFNFGVQIKGGLTVEKNSAATVGEMTC